MLNHVGVLEPDHPRPDPQMHYYIFINFRALADFPIKLITQRQITCPRRGTTHQTSQKCSPCISGNFDKTTMKISVHYLGPLNCPNNPLISVSTINSCLEVYHTPKPCFQKISEKSSEKEQDCNACDSGWCWCGPWSGQIRKDRGILKYTFSAPVFLADPCEHDQMRNTRCFSRGKWKLQNVFFRSSGRGRGNTECVPPWASFTKICNLLQSSCCEPRAARRMINFLQRHCFSLHNFL